MFLLDTNVVSELRKGRSGRADPNVMGWAVLVPATSLYISVITVLELALGIRRLERRDPKQGALMRRWLDGHVLTAFAGRVLPVDIPGAGECARLHVPDPRGERDALIAAIALVHRMTVVTRNVGDFAAIGVAVLDPWAARQP